MIVRKYGRRRAGTARTHPGSVNDTMPGSLRDYIPSEDSEPQDLFSYPYSSQESSSLWPSSNDPSSSSHRNYSSVPLRKTRVVEDSKSGVVGRAKRSRSRGSPSHRPFIPLTSTLMETQEFGEMMEHVDEVNFALDGLKKGQQVRIRRASLCSLISICSTPQQRQLLRAQGIANTIIDAILNLSLDDSLSNMAAAALFFVLTGDGQDERLLESSRSINFLISLLKPIVSAGTEDKARKIGYKLLSILKDTDAVLDCAKACDSTSSDMVSRVQNLLVSCKELNPISAEKSNLKMLEPSSKWIALLAMEKGCSSKISFEDGSDAVRKNRGGFKENLRELGGLDAVVDVTMECYSVMEGWMEQQMPPVLNSKDDLNKQNLMLLLKCLKIMENATFLSKENQTHLLGIRKSLTSHRTQLHVAELMLRVIRVLSGLCLLRRPSAVSCKPKSCHFSNVNDEIISISSTNSSNSVWSASRMGSNASLSHQSSQSDSKKKINSSDSSMLKCRLNSSNSGASSGRLGSLSSDTLRVSNASYASSDMGGGSSHIGNNKLLSHEDSLDPFAFDGDDFGPSKWDLLSKKQRKPVVEKASTGSKEIQHEFQQQLNMCQEESTSGLNSVEELNRDSQHSQESSAPCTGEECCSLLAECLLTGVKVLMNLTNENPSGCQQIALSGGLETMSSLIAKHFPSFNTSPSALSEIGCNGMLDLPNHQKDRHLTEQELDLLVAILGLLVNLVEKDGINRSRLAAARVPHVEGHGESQQDVIPLLCSIFLANREVVDSAEGGKVLELDDEDAVLESEKEAEKMIVEAYAALLLAFLSTESKSIRNAIAKCLPNDSLKVLVPVLEKFLAFHLTLNVMSQETHKAVSKVIESCRLG